MPGPAASDSSRTPRSSAKAGLPVRGGTPRPRARAGSAEQPIRPIRTRVSARGRSSDRTSDRASSGPRRRLGPRPAGSTSAGSRFRRSSGGGGARPQRQAPAATRPPSSRREREAPPGEQGPAGPRHGSEGSSGADVRPRERFQPSDRPRPARPGRPSDTPGAQTPPAHGELPRPPDGPARPPRGRDSRFPDRLRPVRQAEAGAEAALPARGGSRGSDAGDSSRPPRPSGRPKQGAPPQGRSPRPDSGDTPRPRRPFARPQDGTPPRGRFRRQDSGDPSRSRRPSGTSDDATTPQGRFQRSGPGVPRDNRRPSVSGPERTSPQRERASRPSNRDAAQRQGPSGGPAHGTTPPGRGSQDQQGRRDAARGTPTDSARGGRRTPRRGRLRVRRPDCSWRRCVDGGRRESDAVGPAGPSTQPRGRQALLRDRVDSGVRVVGPGGTRPHDSAASGPDASRGNSGPARSRVAGTEAWERRDCAGSGPCGDRSQQRRGVCRRSPRTGGGTPPARFRSAPPEGTRRSRRFTGTDGTPVVHTGGAARIVFSPSSGRRGRDSGPGLAHAGAAPPFPSGRGTPDRGPSPAARRWTDTADPSRPPHTRRRAAPRLPERLDTVRRFGRTAPPFRAPPLGGTS